MARVYVDSCLVIYAVEKPPILGDAARRFLLKALKEHTACVSDLVRMESRVRPLRLGADSLLAKFDAVFARFHVLSLKLQHSTLLPNCARLTT